MPSPPSRPRPRTRRRPPHSAGATARPRVGTQNEQNDGDKKPTSEPVTAHATAPTTNRARRIAGARGRRAGRRAGGTGRGAPSARGRARVVGASVAGVGGRRRQRRRGRRPGSAKSIVPCSRRLARGDAAEHAIERRERPDVATEVPGARAPGPAEGRVDLDHSPRSSAQCGRRLSRGNRRRNGVPSPSPVLRRNSHVCVAVFAVRLSAYSTARRLLGARAAAAVVHKQPSTGASPLSCSACGAGS